MRCLSAVVALLLLIASPVVGLEISEAYVESFLDSLPYRLIYWTRREVIRVRTPPSFSTARIVQEGGTVRYVVQVTNLAAPVRPSQYSYGDFLTQYFYIVPSADKTLKLHGPEGREIPFVVTEKPIAPSEDATREMQSTISEFAALTSRYRSCQRDDSAGQFWSFLGLSLAMGGLTTLCVFGAATEQDQLEALAAGAGAVGCGLLTVFSVGLAIGNLSGYRRGVEERREIEARLEELTSPSD
ncbi:MAG: hypothetical protein KAJ01_00335 [Candidatus Hydrogenedentes bacterium]|nr:hypothetical protein [Candidatus Hydrogenedentota bacterium]